MGRYSRSPSRSRSRDRGGGGGGEEDGHRVHVADLGVDCSQRELEKTFSKYGELNEVWLARNPPCFSFIVYKHRADAEEAIREMDGRVVCGSRVRVSWARPRTRGRPPPSRHGDGDSFRCYQCGERGHFSRDCRAFGGSGNSRGGGGGRRGYDDDYRRAKRRSRSRSRSRNNRRRSHSRSRSRSISRGRRSGDVGDNGVRNGAY